MVPMLAVLFVTFMGSPNMNLVKCNLCGYYYTVCTFCMYYRKLCRIKYLNLNLNLAAGFDIFACAPEYHASKHGLVGYTRSRAVSWAKECTSR